MAFKQKIRMLRKRKKYTSEELADHLDVKVSTVNNWENGETRPLDRNMEALAIVLDTSVDYLLGKTKDSARHHETSDILEIIYKEIAARKHNFCKLCGKPVSKNNIRCHECRWETRWAGHDLRSSWLEKRRKRSHLVKLLSLNRYKPEAVFEVSASSDVGTHKTTLEECTCNDFKFIGVPCKHIFRLAEELGLFYSEHFEAGEYDYAMENHIEGQVRLSLRIDTTLKEKLELIAYREKITLWEQVNCFLERSVSQYLRDNDAK